MPKRAILLALAVPTLLDPAHAQSAAVQAPAAETATEDSLFPSGTAAGLDEYLWQKRIVAVFADSPNDPNFQRQIKALQDDPEALLFRDVIVLTDTDPSVESALREKFRPRGFMLVLVGKDGQIKQRKPFPWTVRELSRAIDKTELRQQELRDMGQRGG
ncbi:DUF4174 domain-containing protein [Pseudooceanicola sp. C21-150M6]|uniref:DUF4174 domain-containing protein n=1 Tax=Pseudooceanicola sp. C21-150M6 TaxID=3434355 RepID=UPI003D7F9F13